MTCGKSVALLPSGFLQEEMPCSSLWPWPTPDDCLLLDNLSGPNYPLSVAFAWAGWNVLQPVDLEIAERCDVIQVFTKRILLMHCVAFCACGLRCNGLFKQVLHSWHPVARWTRSCSSAVVTLPPGGGGIRFAADSCCFDFFWRPSTS